MDRPSFLQLATEIEALRSAWAERHSRRERGARTSLAGYTYQFLVVLLHTVERWLESPKNARADRHVFHEYLADALELTDDGLICVTQIKVRQSSALLRRALEDLWTIYEVAAEEKPHLLDRLSFRVLAAESDLVDVEGAISCWCDEKAGSSGQPVEPFRIRLTVGRETHPEDRLFALLANAKDLRASSPQTYIDRWLGQLIAAAGAPAGSEALAQAEYRILDDLVTLYNRHHEEPSAVYIWTEEDRPPATVVPGRFLTGRQPRVGDLRDGCFAKLPALYNDLHGSARAWIEHIAAGSTDRYRLPLLWLQGRSGSGKSVALLHLLARLHEDGHSPIFWVGQRLSLLPHAMQLAIEASRQGKTPLVGLDDPYTPSVQDSARRDWEEAFAELQAYQDAAEEFSGPVLVVCCGPTEQASQFMADFSDDIEMRRLQVPHEQAREIAELRHWYKERTGQEPPEVGDERVLLVQLFFEWQHGEPLPEFAARFRKRVEGVDRSNALFDRLSRVFALNRLYVGYPPEAVPAGLSHVQEGLLRQLESDEHFGVDVTGERSGLWWLHPHLANTIYDAWYLPEPRNTPARREHLRAGIEDSLAHGKRPSEKTAPLWAIARALRTDAEIDLSQRLQATDIRELLTSCYMQVAAMHGDRLPLELIPVWIDLSFLVPDLTLRPDPIKEAIHQVSPDHLLESGLRLTCHKLLQHLTEMPTPQAGQVLDAVLGLLQAAPDWYEWLPIAWDVVQRARDDRLWALVAGWVAAHPTHRSASRLLEKCLAFAPGEPHLVAAAERLLPSARPDFAWGDVGLRLIEGVSSASMPAAVLTWAQENRRERGVCFLLGALLRRQVSPALQWAHEWLPLWHREASANYVLEPLLAIEDRSERIVVWSLAWLDIGRGDPSFLMQRLLELFSDDERILARIKRWLAETDPNHRSWNFVWQELRKAHPDDAELLAEGRAWLVKADPNHGSWGFVWQELRKVHPDDAELLAEGRAWLVKADSNHGSWGFVWQDLRKAHPDDAELLAEGRAWLAKADPNHGSWGFVWQELQKVHPDDAELLAEGRAWLAKAEPNHGGWGFVWWELRKARPDDAELLAEVRAWLAKADPNLDSWDLVLQKLRKALPDDAELLAEVRAWLTKAEPNHGRWGHVWLELRDVLPDDEELLAAGRAWLAKADPNHRSWGSVWEGLRQKLSVDTELFAEGRGWLKKTDPNHQGWNLVWRHLLKEFPDDEELLAAGRAWLAKADLSHSNWGYVWAALLRIFPEDARLRAQGQAWLGKAQPGQLAGVLSMLRKQMRNAEDSDLGRLWLPGVQDQIWPRVWRERWKLNPGDPTLVSAGCSWLRDRDPEGLWFRVYGDIGDLLDEGSDLVWKGRKWLDRKELSHHSWPYMWRGLLRFYVNDVDFLLMGREWLTQANPADRTWSYGWQSLWAQWPGDPILMKLGKHWLECQAGDISWPFVWEKLFCQYPGDEDFRTFAVHWLGESKPTHKQWVFVWSKLRNSDPTYTELMECGRRWLEQVPQNQPGRDQIEAAVLAELAAREDPSAISS